MNDFILGCLFMFGIWILTGQWVTIIVAAKRRAALKAMYQKYTRISKNVQDYVDQVNEYSTEGNLEGMSEYMNYLLDEIAKAKALQIEIESLQYLLKNKH